VTDAVTPWGELNVCSDRLCLILDIAPLTLHIAEHHGYVLFRNNHQFTKRGATWSKWI